MSKNDLESKMENTHSRKKKIIRKTTDNYKFLEDNAHNILKSYFNQNNGKILIRHR